MSKDDVRTYLIGHSQLDRLAYSRLVREELGLIVVVTSDFAPTAVWDALRHKPDLVLIDANNPSTVIVDSVQMIPRLLPDARLLVLSGVVEPTALRCWAGCRLQGMIVKDAGLDELKLAVAALLEGREYYSVGLRPLLEGGRPGNGDVALSRREAELLPLIARGLSLRDAAREMAVSYKTAESYRTSLLRKVGAKDRVELARYAIRNRIVDP